MRETGSSTSAAGAEWPSVALQTEVGKQIPEDQEKRAAKRVVTPKLVNVIQTLLPCELQVCTCATVEASTLVWMPDEGLPRCFLCAKPVWDSKKVKTSGTSSLQLLKDTLEDPIDEQEVPQKKMSDKIVTFEIYQVLHCNFQLFVSVPI